MRAVYSREFGAFFIGRQSAVLACRIEEVAIGWQIFQLRHSAVDLGLVGLVLFVPHLLLALPAGILADRVDRRATCVVSSCVEALGLGGFVALIALRVHSVPVYLAAVLFVGIAHTVGTPAQRSLLVNIVPETQFVRAQGPVSSFTQLITIAGPALGGVLIAIGTPIAFMASGAAYVCAAVAFAFLRRHEIEYLDEPVARAAMEGLLFIFKQRIILGAISLDLFAVLFGGAVALFPMFATEILHVGPRGFGVLRAAPAIGAGIVAAYVARHSILRRIGPLLFGCVSGFGLATIVFGLSRNFVLSIVALILAGGFDMVSVVVRSAIVQLGTPNIMRGRVLAVENIFIGASNELGAFESGGVAALIGAAPSVVLGGAATIAVIALWSALFPELRKFDTLEV